MVKTHICELCSRTVSTLTEHHLIPLQKGGKNKKTIHLCPTCHKQIHALFTNRELAARFNTLEALKKDIRIIKFLRFIENIPGDSHVEIKKSRHVRKSS